jgi:hypothetical protein
MPKIKVYTGNGAAIPIQDAKVSTGFQCPWTKKVFSGKSDYLDHLRGVRESRIRSRIRANNRGKFIEKLSNQSSFEDIIKYIENNSDFIFDMVIDGMTVSEKNKVLPLRSKFFIKITYLNLSHKECASNSHSCPRDGVTNWGGRNVLFDGTPAPKGYPGFYGKIEFQFGLRVKPENDVFRLGQGYDILKLLGLHTGSGGGMGNNRYGYDVTLFDSDWPGLTKVRVFDILKNGKTTDYFHHGAPKYFA